MIKIKILLKVLFLKLLITGFWVAIIGLVSCKADANLVDPDADVYPKSNLSYSKHIRPIFIQDCASIGVCHQATIREAGLDLETDPPNFQGNTTLVIIPNISSASLLFQVLFQSVGDTRQMPPDVPRLSDGKINAIGTWIDEGAITTN